MRHHILLYILYLFIKFHVLSKVYLNDIRAYFTKSREIAFIDKL